MQVGLSLSQSTVKDAKELLVTAKLTNDNTQSVRLNMLFLPLPSIVLGVRDSAGNAVPLGPPPVPPLDDGVSGRQELASGESVSFHYTGNGLFGVSLPPGTYAIRFFLELENFGPAQDWEGTLESDWVNFTVGPEKKKRSP